MGTTTDLRTLRGERGWSQRELAAEAGVNISTIFELEAGRVRRPQAATIGKLAAALDVSIPSLLALFDYDGEAAS